MEWIRLPRAPLRIMVRYDPPRYSVITDWPEIVHMRWSIGYPDRAGSIATVNEPLMVRIQPYSSREPINQWDAFGWISDPVRRFLSRYPPTVLVHGKESGPSIGLTIRFPRWIDTYLRAK